MEAGQTIAGKYRLNRLLGTGGMASVWSATNVFTEREFAIKFMLPQVARTPEAARRFLLEAKVSARINHPNIIEVIDVGQAEDGSLFLVMELLTGVSLDVAVRRQQPPMTAHEFLQLMRDVAVALAAAHRSGVIHRDLKPTNVFLHNDRDGRIAPKVLDFGVSKILEEENNMALTVVGTVLGSPLYMSPEQATGAADIDGRTDVFAFGGILFEALTGQRAFEAPNFNALIVTIATQQPKSIDVVAPQLPESLRALVRDCMVTDKTKRLASFDVIVERLQTILPELEPSRVSLPSPYATERPSDPDATNALPISRPTSERSKAASAATPPGGHPSPGVIPSAPVPVVLASAASATPPATTASAKAADAAQGWIQSHLHMVGTYVHRMPPRTVALAVGGGGVLVILALIVGISAAFSRGSSASPAAVPASRVTATTSKAPAPTPTGSHAIPSADESADVPTFNVDSLPVATRGPAPARGNGRLSIVATPGWCSVSVDGVPRGVTPLTSFDLTAGTHRVDCVPPNGKPRTASVNVAEGTATHYKFALE
jgi:serine/threonine-protein kinase